MTLGEMQAALLRDLIQRDDINSEALRNSVRYIHRQMQLDFNWRAMEARVTGLVYAANSTAGVVVESDTDENDCKAIREVFIETGGGLETVWPSNESKASRARRISQIAQDAQPSEAGGWNQAWYEAARRLVLLIPPAAQILLTVDFYRFLPFYLDADGLIDPTLSDWFSENIPDVVQAGAAYWLCKNILEDQRAETFYQRYIDGLKMAFEADVRAKQGATAAAYSPPQPGTARPA